MLPWVFWCCVYTVWRIIGAYRTGTEIDEAFAWWMLLTGPAIHLWYLPFAFVATCLASALRVYHHSSGLSTMVMSAIGVSAALISCSWLLSSCATPIPLAQWTFGFPAVCIGLALPHSAEFWQRFVHASALALIVTLVSIAMWAAGFGSLSVPYVVGTLALVTAWLIPFPETPAIARACSLSYGIYLVHPLVASIVRQVTHIQDRAVTAVIVLLLTIGLVAMLRRGPLRLVM